MKMISLKKVSFILGFMMIIAGCSSKYGLGEGASSITEAALKANNLLDAPSWILNGGREGLSAIGSADITKAGLQFARNEALAMARDELSRMISTKVEGLVSSAVSQSVGNNAYDSIVEKYSEQITRQIVSQSLVGSKQMDTWISPDGKQIYVLVEQDETLSDKIQKSIIQNISKDNNMPVQKDKFLDALNKALSNGF
ncbi:LPP20 family lipoprotein [Helicobacter sp. MIT 99-5507]|uniref:LPP20 family lipoprotein n=1 Tax=Helicobacter sp. MIT 99-5507 TaxID=152489 RepID=UPI000E1E3745|nr:LPP20 family lipoprotein [Helicobacter sp. MIT 99-5507]RDU57318.1 hypothetical protein CQA42_05060 [Helicobacter sp. MIT 99-5507]